MANKHQQPEEDGDAVATKRRSNRPHYDPAKQAPASQRQPVAATTTSSPPIRGPPHPEQEARLLTKKQVLARVAVSYPCIWKWMLDGRFPRSREIGGKAVWIEAEINAWINALYSSPQVRYGGRVNYGPERGPVHRGNGAQGR
jgi:predicted DNA-binding transcriptional regulator AlpA